MLRAAARGCWPRPADARAYLHRRGGGKRQRSCRCRPSHVFAGCHAAAPTSEAALIQQRYQLLEDEKQVTLHQAHRNGCADGGEDAKAGRVGDGLFLALLLLLGLPFRIVAAGLLLRMMDGAGRIAHTLWMVPTSLPSVMMASVVNLHTLNSGRLASSFDFGFSSRIAVYLLRGSTGLPSFCSAVGRADLHQLRLRGDGLGDVRLDLGLIAVRVGAGALLAEVGKTAACCALSAWGNRRNCQRGNKLRIALVERRIFEDEQDLLSIQNCRLRTGSRMRVGLPLLALQSSLKQAESACSCWSAGNFASNSAWPTPISSA